MGYGYVRANGEKYVVINDDGRILQQAFLMKANQGFNNVEVIERCRALGIKKLCSQRLTEIFRNPLYCGVIVSGHLYEPVQGVHEALVSERVFWKVNGRTAENSQEYTQQNSSTNCR